MDQLTVDQLGQDQLTVDQLTYYPLIVAGDFNLDVNRRDDKHYDRAKQLSLWTETADSLGLQWCETGPTYKSHGVFQGQHRISTLDYVFAWVRGGGTAVLVPDALSDHSPVLATFRAPGVMRREKERRTTRDWKRTNWDLLR